MFIWEEFIDEIDSDLQLITLDQLKHKIIDFLPSTITLLIIGVGVGFIFKKIRKKPSLTFGYKTDSKDNEGNVVKEIKMEEIFEEDQKEAVYRQEFIESWLKEFPKNVRDDLATAISRGHVVLANEVPKSCKYTTCNLKDSNDEFLWIKAVYNRDILYQRIFLDNKPTPFISVKKLVTISNKPTKD